VVRYEAAVVSLPHFAQRLPVPQFLIYPSIDPISDKNRELSRDEVDRILQSLDIPRDKPMLLQVSRFDRFKDPVGMVEAYRLLKKSHDCRLVLAGPPVDEPEGEEVFAEVQNAAAGDPDIHLVLLPPASDLEINALQRAATIVFQKSIREGFDLSVAEALWKSKPVIGGETGGITVQVIPGMTGYLVNSPEGAAFYAKRLLNEPELMTNMGLQGREYARHRFLITRQLQEYLGLMIHLREARTSMLPSVA
jgi:trehalose synthase